MVLIVDDLMVAVVVGILLGSKVVGWHLARRAQAIRDQAAMEMAVALAGDMLATLVPAMKFEMLRALTGPPTGPDGQPILVDGKPMESILDSLTGDLGNMLNQALDQVGAQVIAALVEAGVPIQALQGLADVEGGGALSMLTNHIDRKGAKASDISLLIRDGVQSGFLQGLMQAPGTGAPGQGSPLTSATVKSPHTSTTR